MFVFMRSLFAVVMFGFPACESPGAPGSWLWDGVRDLGLWDGQAGQAVEGGGEGVRQGQLWWMRSQVRRWPRVMRAAVC